jgi:hypothetical protein
LLLSYSFNNIYLLYSKDTTGLWNYEEMPPPPSIHSYKPETAQIQILDESLQPAGKIWPSLVIVNFCLPYNVNGLRTSQNTQVKSYLCFFVKKCVNYHISF